MRRVKASCAQSTAARALLRAARRADARGEVRGTGDRPRTATGSCRAPDWIRTNDTRFRRALERSTGLPPSLISAEGVPTPLGVEVGRAAIKGRCVRRLTLDNGTVVDCKSRDFYQCPHCATVYRGDWQAIIRDGMYSLSSPARIVFMTLMAPSFGKVHHVPGKKDSKVRPCACGVTHTSADTALRGVAVDPARYDYFGQVAWNRDCGALWRVTSIYLRRALPYSFDYVKVYEWQARGVLHLHLILRLPPSATADDVETIRRTCLGAHCLSEVDGQYRGWGDRIDVQDMGVYMPRKRGDFAAKVDGVVRYVGKVLGYVGKSLLAQASHTRAAYPEAFAHFIRLGLAAKATPCGPRCVGDGCRSTRHRNLGASSHVVSVSRKTEERPGWSVSGLTRKVLAERRRAWFAARDAERLSTVERPRRSAELTVAEAQALLLHRAGIAYGVVPLRT